MDIGIGLPNPVPGTPGRTLIEWAKRAEAAGFSTLATIDRIAYPSYESLIALAAAGAVTERIGLFTNVLLAPTRNPVLLAKEAASVDQVSGGRLTLGLGVGAREDDFSASGTSFKGRGRRFDHDLELMHAAWRGEAVNGALKPVSPRPVRGDAVPIVIGGASSAAIERTTRWGLGWTSGGAPPDQASKLADAVRKAWAEAGKGAPKLIALTYFAVGDDAEARARDYLSDYYGEWGPGIAARIPKDRDTLLDTRQKFAEGFDELIFDPTIAELDQLEELAKVVL